MGIRPRMTTTTAQVLEALAQHPDRNRYGLEVMGLTGLPSGTVFPILARLEAHEWLESGWEDVDPRVVGRPRRRYYRLTGPGHAAATAALARVADQRHQRARMLRPAEGTA